MIIKPIIAFMPGARIGLPVLLSALLAGCQALPAASPNARTQAGGTAIAALPKVPTAYKVGKLDSTPFGVRLESDGHGDRLVFSLEPRLGRRSGAGAFRTQASDISQLAYFTVCVSGPDISTPICNAGGLIPVNGTNNNIVIEDVPNGKNRVITAQFYNASQQPVANAVSMGVYSSGNHSSRDIDVMRRFLVLGRVIQGLLANNRPDLARSLDASALQARLDLDLYGGDGTPGPYQIDPVQIDTDQMVADLIAAAGRVADVLVTIYFGSTLTLPVTGLLGNDTLSVRVDDPTSQIVTASNGMITVNNIAPGTWPVYIKLNSSSHFSYSKSTLGSTVFPPSLPNQTTPERLLIGSQNFINGDVVTTSAYALVPDPPVNPVPVSNWTRSGAQFKIKGSGFYPDIDSNQVKFTREGISLPAQVTSATSTELVVTVPNVEQAGAYTLRTASGCNGSPGTGGGGGIGVISGEIG
ncbi:MAG TPA: hypothetical protein V6D23_09405, partial [Candidatus Obscuribacterales bacterium]